MAQIILSRKTGRAVKWAFFIALSIVFSLIGKKFGYLSKGTYISGWALLFVMLVLTIYNGRKKIPFLPLFNSQGWLQFHVYAGYFTVLIFLAHIHFGLPTGRFEISLAILYLMVTLSGIVGLIISRTFPKRLTSRGGEVIYERIPVIRRELGEKAKALALKSVTDAQASTAADFYSNELADFFSGPRNLWGHVFEVRSPLNRLLKKIEDLSRFLNDKERAVMAQIADLVRQKDGLDYHRSLQFTLKLWLFVHIPLTYSLLIFSFVHVILIYAFSGGAR